MAVPHSRATMAAGSLPIDSEPSWLHLSDISLPPFHARVRTARHENAYDGLKFDNSLQYAVSSSSSLLATRMQDNIYIWGDTNFAATTVAAAGQPSAPPNTAVGVSDLNPINPNPSSGTDTSDDLLPVSAFPIGPCGAPTGRFAAISLGDGHAAAITVRGELLTWGRNTRGQCGHDHRHHHAAPHGAEQSTDDSLACPSPSSVNPQPLHFPVLDGNPCRWLQLPVRSVSCGGEHTLAITKAGVFAWGCNAFGQCGLGDDSPDLIPRPATVLFFHSRPVSQLAAGRTHSLALTASGEVLSWGDSASGQLGHGDRRPRRAPVVLEALWALPVVQIVAGDAHSAAVTGSGHVFAWGCNFFAQLGIPPEQRQEQHLAVQGTQLQLSPLPSPPPHPSQAQQGPEARTGRQVQPQEGAGPSRDVEVTNDLGQWRINDDPHPQRAREGAQQAVQHQEDHPRHVHQEYFSPQLGVDVGVQSPISPGIRMLRNSQTPGSVRRAALRHSGAAGHVNSQWLLAMVEIGIPERNARIAMEETGNAGVEVAIEWLFAADRSAILDGPPAKESARSPPFPAPDSRRQTRATDGSAVGADANQAPGRKSQTGHDAVATATAATAAGNNPAHARRRRGQAAGNSSGSDGDSGSSSSLEVVFSGAKNSWYGSTEDYGSTESQSGWWNDLVVSAPRRVPLKDVRFVAAGARHTVAITDGGVFAWGDGACGALGLGDCESRDLPCRLVAFTTATASSPHHPAATDSQPYSRSRLGSGGGGNSCGAAGGGNACGYGGDSSAAAFYPPGDAKTAVIQRVVCGAQHTLFLAQDGSVYWCGTMSYRPKSPEDGPAAAVAPGRKLPSHPASKEALLLGSNGRTVGGGLGRGIGRSTSGKVVFSDVPRRLNLVSKQGSNSGSGGGVQRQATRGGVATCPVVYDIASRGASSAVLMCSPRELPLALNPLCGSKLLESLRAAVKAAAMARAAGGGGELSRLSASLKEVILGMKTVLSSPAAISAAFGRHSGMGLDGQLLEDVLDSIGHLFLTSDGKDGAGGAGTADTVVDLHRYNALGALQAAATALVDDLVAHVQLLGAPERAQVLLAALQHPLLSDSQHAQQLLPKLVWTVMNAPQVVRTWLVRWWAEYPGPLLESRVVAPLQSYLTRELGATKKLTTSLMNVIKVLARVEEAASRSNSLPPEAFYNTLISEKLDVLDHYSAWRQAQSLKQELSSSRNPAKEAPFSFCGYPFLLNTRAKSQLLHLEARFKMEQSVAQARMEAQLYGGCVAAERRAADGPVLLLVKPASIGACEDPNSSSSNSTSSISTAGHASSRSRDSDASRGEGARGGSSNSSSGRSSAGSSFCIGSGSSFVGGSLRSLFSLLRRRIGISNADDMLWKGPPASKPSSSELPRPGECSMPGMHSDMCIVRVRRIHLVEDALEELGRQAPRDLLKPLRVHFIGEEGIDAGGVKKEFFALLMERLLSLDYGMMSYNEASRTYWFNPASLEPPDSYFLLGLVLGLAVYNRVLLDFPAPLLLYQKLRGTRQLGLRDLEAWQPELARGMRELLEYDGPQPMWEVFGLTFSADVDRFGHIETVPLKPGGEQIPVTEANRAEYVSLLTAWHLGGNVETQFGAFASGFRVVCRGPAMSLFNAQELERLVCGNPRLDFWALREAACYEGGYSRDSTVVCWLWDIVLHELSVEEQRAFLKFFTGSDRSPLGGLGSLCPLIQRDGPDSHKLPTAHTCFNTLLLPEYDNRDKLAALLQLAITNSEGFGLQ